VSLAESVRGTRDPVPPNASASITSSCGTSVRCTVTCSGTSRTITSGGLTSPWTRMRPFRGPSNRPPSVRSAKSHTSAGCITTTNVERRERRVPRDLRENVRGRGPPGARHARRRQHPHRVQSSCSAFSDRAWRPRDQPAGGPGPC
jgi:hypothetical protein